MNAVPSTFFAVRLDRRMWQLGLKYSRVARKLKVRAEHIARIADGRELPSIGLLRELCPILDLDIDEMNLWVEMDKIVRKCGRVFWVTQGMVSEIAPIYCAWDVLNQNQQQMILKMVRKLSRGGPKGLGVKAHPTRGAS